METNQNLRQLGPFIKLFKRHLLEWNNLLACQKEVRRLSEEKANQLPPHPRYSTLAQIEQVTNKAIRLTRLTARQFRERQQMKARHQQEATDLEQVIRMP